MVPKYSKELIADLADRVRSHNEGKPASRVKLTDLKKWYAHGYQGPSETERTASAWSNVDRHMAKAAGPIADQPSYGALAKAGSFDGSKHPRNRGKFASKGDAPAAGDEPAPAPIALALPTTPEEHRALQAASPAYAALTSDTVPERRNQVRGAFLRYGLGTAAGAALVAALGRHGGSGAAGRMLQRGSAFVGHHVASIPVAAVSYPLAGAAEAVVSPVARRFGRPIAQGSFYRAADLLTGGAGLVGERVGRGVGWLGAHGATKLIHGVDAAAGSRVSPRRAALRRSGARAALSIGAGALLTQPIKGTILDPEVLGANEDAFSYRTIQKMAGGADLLDGVIADVLAKSAAGGGTLAKAGLYSLFGRRVLPVAAGLAAAAGGAGAAEGAHAVLGTRDGDPYRDSHGRFTSRANAVTLGAGLAGAAAAGTAAYLALRGHNVGALTRAVAKGAAHVDNAIALASRPEGSGDVAQLIAKARDQIELHQTAHDASVAELQAGRGSAVQERIKQDPEFIAGSKRLDVYGASSEAHYKERIRHEVNGKLATILSQTNEFRIPGKGKPDSWVTIGNVRAAAGGGAGRADHAARDAVLKAVDSATPAEFDHAIAGLSPQQQVTAKHWFDTRQTAIDGVEGQMKAHSDKLDDLTAKATAADGAHDAARRGTLEAKAVADRAVGEPETTEARAKLADAEKAEETAGTAASRARQAVLKHKAKPSGVTSPVTGDPVAPASEQDLMALRSGLRNAAHDRATKIVDSQIKAKTTKLGKELKAKVDKIKADVETARGAQMAKIEARGHRLLAAQAMIGRSHNVVPERAVYASKRALVAARALHDAHQAEMGALRDVIEGQNMLAAVRQAKEGRVPDGMTREAAADLAQRETSVVQGLQDAMHRHAQAQLQTATAAQRLGRVAGGFRQQMLTQAAPGMPRTGRLPSPVYRALLRDVDRASAGAQDAFHGFLASPSGAALRGLAQAGYGHVAGAAGAVYGGARDVVRALTSRETSPGSGTYEWSSHKLAVATPIAITLANDFAHDAYRYGKDQLGYQLGVSGKPNSKAPTTVKLERHVDPVTGGGYFGLSVPDPQDKAERVLLYGEHYKDANARGEKLAFGARVSAVRGRLSGQGSGGQGGQPGQGGARHQLIEAPGLSEDQRKGVRAAVAELKDRAHRISVEDGNDLRLRPNSDSSKDKLAADVEHAIRNQHLKGGSPSNGKLYYDALASTVGSFQTPILKSKAAYRLLTGFNAGNPQRTGAGVFETSADSDFGDQQKEPVLGALRDEVDRVMTAYPPRDAQQRGNLLRAVALVGAQKGASPDDMKPIMDKVRGAAATGGAPSKPKPVVPAISDALPEVFDQRDLRDLSHPHAERIAASLNMRGQTDVADTAAVLDTYATALHQSHGLPMRDAVKAAAGAVRESAGEPSSASSRMTRDALRTADFSYFKHFMQRHADRAQDEMGKVYLDDLPALLKGFLDDAAEAVANEARAPDGEWTGGGGGGHGASRLAREGVEEGTSKLSRDKGDAPPPKGGSNYTPAKITRDASAFLGSEAASYAGTKGVEGILSRFFPEEAGGVKLIGAIRNAFTSGGAGAAAGVAGRTALRAGAKLAGSAAGGISGFHAGGAAGDAAARGAYHLAGAKTPNTSGPQLGGGEQVAETLGQIAGGIVGGGLGAGVASIATGAAGGYLGGVIGRNAYDAGATLGRWFGGYDSGTTHRALSRATASAQRAAQPAQPGQPGQQTGSAPNEARRARGEFGVQPTGVA